MVESELDILTLDSDIKKNFEIERSHLQIYKQRLVDLKLTASSDNLLDRTTNELRKNILNLEKTIAKLESNEELNFYIIKTSSFIQKYKEILKTPLKVSFMGKQTRDSKEKRMIIHNYLLIAQQYIKIDIKTRKKLLNVVCGYCTDKTMFDIQENIHICLSCGHQQEILQHTSSFKDIDRVNISTKYKYDKKTHFRDCINQYQGKQNCTIDKKVYEGLIDAFDRHHLLNGTKSTPIKKRFSRITKEHILMFLKELGHSKHYENVTLIHYNITGIKPDDITHLEDQLMSDFDVLIETYDKEFRDKIDRVNFISTQYVLYQLLMRYKHPCKKEDFVILKTIDRKFFHDNIVRGIFMILGWNHNPI